MFLKPAPVPISSLCFLVVPGCQKGRPAPGPHPSPETSQAGCLALAPPSQPLRVNLDLGFIGPREPQVPFPGDKHPPVDGFFLEGRESEQRPNFTTGFPQQRAATAHSPGIPGGWGRRERSTTGEGDELAPGDQDAGVEHSPLGPHPLPPLQALLHNVWAPSPQPPAQWPWGAWNVHPKWSPG